MDTKATEKRSPVEIQELKLDWCADPCWDIEHTEGFEAHHDELVAYRREWEAKREAERQAALEKRAEALGCPGNVKLACYIDGMEYQLDRLRERIEALEDGAGRF